MNYSEYDAQAKRFLQGISSVEEGRELGLYNTAKYLLERVEALETSTTLYRDLYHSLENEHSLVKNLINDFLLPHHENSAEFLSSLSAFYSELTEVYPELVGPSEIYDPSEYEDDAIVFEDEEPVSIPFIYVDPSERKDLISLD